MNIQEIKDAVCSVIEISDAEFTSKTQKRAVIYARILFSHHAYNACGNKSKIAGVICKTEGTVSYYLEQYDWCMNDGVFKNLNHQIEVKIQEHV
jgi:hypothetical protein